jgi:hypothetical protein
LGAVATLVGVALGALLFDARDGFAGAVVGVTLVVIVHAAVAA